ncbi:hypothetical protein GCM10011512_21550 [Tersicoccus solisilvae]|uniref:CHRD domain-containing protein n=1 Tax=Tersicoccus solisilvae TaxID=1882339 RepID=A0ABQ1PBW7_9MICC|nr:hypothetical protein [Tersicoccus solisilvae]GGC94209.1 hypothetical protein GCM10011512_21550 [Tersicoccus solisilvae]
MKRTSALLAAPALALGALALAAAPAQAHDADTTVYQTQLKALNGSSASGSVWVSVHGTEATVTENVTGLPASFNGAAYPHVQHIHIGAMGMCPDASADTNGDGVVSVTEGAPHYGKIAQTLTTSGDTSPATATDLKLAPGGATIDYKRTFTLSAETVSALKAGTASIVVHGLDPATLSPAAKAAKSDIVPSLPLAATSPALCGELSVSQMGAMPNGAPETGVTPAARTTTTDATPGILASAGGVLVAGAAAVGLNRRRAARKAQD